jgi:hypothetical protein
MQNIVFFSIVQSFKRIFCSRQFILAPQFVAFTVGFGLRDLVVDPGDRFRIWEIILLGSLIMTIALLCSTRPGNNNCPKVSICSLLESVLSKKTINV